MAYSAQMELYNLKDYNRVSEKDTHRGAAKRYESTTDVSAWSMSNKKRSQYIENIIKNSKAPDMGGGDYLSEEELKQLSREQLIQEIQNMKNEMMKRESDIKEAREFLEEKADLLKKNQELQDGFVRVVYEQRLIEQEKEKDLQAQKDKIKELEENIENFKGSVEEMERLKKEKDEKIKKLNAQVKKVEEKEAEVQQKKKSKMGEGDIRKLEQENCENLAIIRILERELRDRDEFILSQNMDINNLNGAKRELRQIERIVRKSQVKADRKGRGKDKTDLEATDEESVDELEEEKRKEQKRFRCKIPEPTEKSRLSYAIEGLFEKNEQLAHDSEEYQSMVDELKKLLEESKGQMDRQAQENKDLRERIRKGKRLPEEDEPNDLTNSFSESKIDEIMNQFEGHPLDAIRGLKTLLDDVKRELRKLKEENCELQGSLHELRKNYPSICQELVEENDRYEQEIKALKEQMANVEKLTADLELAGEQRVELEREYATLMQNLEDKKNEEIRKLTEQLAEERAKSEDLDRKLFEMRNKLENLEALEIEREKMRNKLIKENDRYERQLKEREEYIEDLQKSIQAMNDDREAEQEKARCNRESDSQQMSADVCELVRSLKQSWESAYLDKLNKMKCFYERKMSELRSGGNFGDAPFGCGNPCPDRFSMLCEKILSRGIEALNLDDLMFLHEEIYQAMSKVFPGLNRGSDLVLDLQCETTSMVEIPVRLPKEPNKKKLRKSCSAKKIQFSSRSKTQLKKKGSSSGTCIKGEIFSGAKPGKSFTIKSKF